MDFKSYESWSDSSYSQLVFDVINDKWQLIRVLNSESRDTLLNDFINTVNNVNIEILNNMEQDLITKIKVCITNQQFINKLKDIDMEDTYFFEFESCIRYGGAVPLTNYEFLL